MRWGSLSSQVRGLKVILANGTLLELKNAEENPHLWRALGVMVGRLGIITELTMRIIPQKAVKRNLDSVNYKQFAAQIQATQRDYVAAKNANNYTAVQDALFQLDNTQALWHYGLNLVWRVDYQFLGHEPQNVLPNIDSVSPNVHAMEGPSMNDVFSQVSWLALICVLQSMRNGYPTAGRMTFPHFCFYCFDGAATSRSSTSQPVHD
jgi:FAD/FMN-containing dehydrogenase